MTPPHVWRNISVITIRQKIGWLSLLHIRAIRSVWMKVGRQEDPIWIPGIPKNNCATLPGIEQTTRETVAILNCSVGCFCHTLQGWRAVNCADSIFDFSFRKYLFYDAWLVLVTKLECQMSMSVYLECLLLLLTLVWRWKEIARSKPNSILDDGTWWNFIRDSSILLYLDLFEAFDNIFH